MDMVVEEYLCFLEDVMLLKKTQVGYIDETFVLDMLKHAPPSTWLSEGQKVRLQKLKDFWVRE